MKSAFMDAYRQELLARYQWARNDDAKLDRFMKSVANTLAGDNTWSRDGEAYHAALKTCNLPKRITLKALQALPD